MKRIVAMLAVLALGLVVAAWAIGSEDGDDYPGMMGPGHRSGQMGPGMMGGGMMGPMWQAGDLSDEEYQKLSELHWNTMRSMHATMPQHWRRMAELRDAMSEYPLDTERVMAAWKKAQEDHAAMFQMRLQMMRQMQEVLGEERWSQMMEWRGGMGRGGMMGGGRRSGPGMMDR